VRFGPHVVRIDTQEPCVAMRQAETYDPGRYACWPISPSIDPCVVCARNA
jgi:hypothetical protein